MKDYCKQILGKSIRDITIEDLKEFFLEEKEETEILEFKSGKGDFDSIFTKNILKTTSAFLNSSGGVLIWGAPEDRPQEKGGPKKCVGELVLLKDRKEKDQVINRISSSISYMPNNIKVERLDSYHGFVYIIEVQESESKPHQYNGQYFIRLDGQSKPAPHYIVDSLFNQIKFADIECDVIIKDYKFDYFSNHHNITLAVYYFNFSKNIIAKNVELHLYLESGVFENNKLQDIEPKCTSSLHFGVNPSTTLKILINDEKFKNEEKIITLQSTIRADNAEARISKFNIDLEKLKDSLNFKNSVETIINNKPFINFFNADELSDKETYKRLFLDK